MKQSLVLFFLVTVCFTTVFSRTAVNPTDEAELLKDRLLGVNRASFTYDNHTYEISNFRESWSKAKYYCKWLGMELVSIETEDEQKAILEQLASFSQKELFYTSLNDIAAENEFFWESTGLRVGPFESWGFEEPTMSSSFNCATLTLSGTWRVEPCTYRWLYICESKDACNCEGTK